MRPLSVVIPAYGAAGVLRECLESLRQFLPEECDVHIFDDATPDGCVAAVAGDFVGLIPRLHYVRRPENLGFVLNCNQAIEALLGSGNDILLLNSDALVTAGAIEEMSAVLHLHEKHGAVTPRSDNATIFSVPVFERLPATQSFALWQTIREILPRYQIMPACVGFCLLIRNIVLRHFGVFDPAYSPGYNEENDLICRMNRHGYSAIAANHAFVFHREASSFSGRRAALESRNRAILDSRYPEYSRIVAEHYRFHVDPVDRFAPLWIGGRRRRILFDLHSFPAEYSGTSEFALSLLLYLAPLLEAKYDLSIGLQDETRDFFAGRLTGYRILDETGEQATPFDLAFRPVQIFSWRELYRLARLGARICYTHQDSIAVRCQYLSGAALRTLHNNLPQLTDRIVAISHFTQDDFEALHRQTVPFDVVYQATHPARQSPPPAHGNVLIVGNRFQHKGVLQAVQQLQGLVPLAVLGGDRPDACPAGVEWFVSGGLSNTQIASLFADARVVVYPSYYEGFGLPVLDSLAMGRPVVAVDSAVSRELRQLTRFNSNLYLVGAHADLPDAVSRILRAGNARPGAIYRTWPDVAAEYARIFDELLDTPLDPERLRFRWNWLSAMDAQSPLA